MPSMFYEFEPVTPDTLRAYHDLNARHDTYDDLHARLAEGRLRYEQLRVLRSPRGVEAAVLLGAAPVVLPRVRHDLPDDGMRALARHLRSHLAPSGQDVILDASLAGLRVTPFVDEGWTLASHAALYETALTSRSWPLDPDVHERPALDLLAPDLRRLAEALARTDGRIGDTDGTDPRAAFERDALRDDLRVFVLSVGGDVAAAATLTLDPRGNAGVQLIGVHPERRGRGLGRRLHGHVLAKAAEVAARHVGGTDASNTAMRHIFERGGAVLVTEQVRLTVRTRG